MENAFSFRHTTIALKTCNHEETVKGRVGGVGGTENVQPNDYEARRNKCCHLRHFRATGRATVHLKPLKSAGKMYASQGNRAAGAKPATGMNDGTIYCVTL